MVGNWSDSLCFIRKEKQQNEQPRKVNLKTTFKVNHIKKGTKNRSIYLVPF